MSCFSYMGCYCREQVLVPSKRRPMYDVFSFPPDSGRYLAFGLADHRIYYYDLRKSRIPLCAVNGHSKTVSYIKFVDSTNIVSASTDNTLKLWDLSMCMARGIEGRRKKFFKVKIIEILLEVVNVTRKIE